MADAIQDAIEAAKKAAETAPAPTPAQVPATVAQTTGTAVAAPTSNTPLTAADMMQGSFSVDSFAKVTEDGIKIGDSALIENLHVKVDLSEVFYYFGVRYGNPPVYKKTVNRVKSLDGVDWAKVLQTAAQVDAGKFRGEYRSGDIPMTLLDEAKDIKGKSAGAVGLRVGKSLSTTEWREWEALLRSAQKKGVNLETGVLELNVSFKKRNNAQNQVWGVLVFSLVGEYVDADEAAEQAA